MREIGQAVLRWTCVRCGYRIEVVARLDGGVDLFIARVDLHIEETCGRADHVASPRH